MYKLTKKTIAITVGTVLLLGGGGAYAYWTAGGSGSGVADTATSSSIEVEQTSNISGLRPLGPPQTLSGVFNNVNGSPVFVTSVTASIGAVTKAANAPAGPCTAADYTLTGAVMAVGEEVPAGVNQGSWTGATIAFNNNRGGTPVNQDACKGASVLLSYTAL